MNEECEIFIYKKTKKKQKQNEKEKTIFIVCGMFVLKLIRLYLKL